VREHPGRHGDSDYVERMAKRLAYQFQAIERTNSSQDVARVSTLPTVGFQQSQPTEALQHEIEEQSFGIALDQATTKLTQDRVVEPRIIEVQSERVLPIDPSTNSVRGLAVGQILNELKHRDQCQTPWTLGWLTTLWEEMRKFAVLDQ
jgi:primosomal protein N''